ncbi:MAG TPA: efflux RND transporter periplasmic adaptor subunit [Candidatus Saccharimonadales bacterium]|nr:efflux RND transporter periplasmic adaptor subunit [Candidatus Saccharimonadales bacterium]
MLTRLAAARRIHPSTSQPPRPLPAASAPLAPLAPLVALGLFLAGCHRAEPAKATKTGPPEVPVTVARVQVVQLDRTIAVVGTLFAKDEATISAEVEGQVEGTMVEFGDRLTNGQIIAQINTTTYLALALQAEANVARARATRANADQNRKRLLLLSQEKIASPSDVDQAVAAAEQAGAELKAAEANEVIAKLNLERSHVRAPFDAAVADRIASAGDFMKVGSPLFRIVNDGVLKFIVNAPERHAAQVQKGQPVFFTVDAWPGEQFEGRVYLISPQVNTATRAFAFGALVQNDKLRLRANTFARGEVVVERNVPTSVVPLDAIVNFAGVTKVYVVEKGLARGRPVQVGRVRDEMQEVLSGLQVDEIVVTSGQTKLFDGAKVRIKEDAPKQASK